MNRNSYNNNHMQIKDFGAKPFVANLKYLSQMNTNFRAALWTGNYLQVTLMCIPAGGDIGLEKHDNFDQLLYIQEGCGLIKMGKCKDSLPQQQKVDCHDAVIIPACTWHNLINIGNTPLKLFSVYAPPQHPFGTVHPTKKAALESEQQNEPHS